MDIDLEKSKLREDIKAKRNKMSEIEREEKSSSIAKTVISLDCFKSSKNIFLYMPLRKEVNTIPIIEEAIKQKKNVLLPRCLKNKPLMNFYYINSLNDLETGSYNIREPKISCPICEEATGLLILPGLSFDGSGNRLGYGKGYYDRFLSCFKGTTIGLCFSEFLSNSPLPVNKYDERVDFVITENGL